MYIFVYSLLGVIQGMGFTYLSSVLSTIGRKQLLIGFEGQLTKKNIISLHFLFDYILSRQVTVVYFRMHRIFLIVRELSDVLLPRTISQKTMANFLVKNEI
jgi:hypothetical protein